MPATQPLHALKELSNIIAFGASLEDVFNTALEQMITFMGADAGSIQLLCESGVLHTVAVYGDIGRRLFEARTQFTVDESGLHEVLESDHAHVIHNLTSSLSLAEGLSALLRQENLTTAVFIALKMKGRSIGTLSVAFQREPKISSSRLAWFEAMTNLISISLYNVQLLTDLNAKQTELQRAWQAVTDAQEMERSRLSRELHDDVGQALTSLTLRLKALQSETDIEVIGDRINGLRYLTGQTIEEVRRISMDLRPVVFDELGLIPAIRSYVRECSTWGKLDISFETSGDITPLRPDLEIACYRAIQEGLTNIIRHARATRASVDLAYHAESVMLTIYDNGVGMSASQESKGVGLLGMQERVRLVGGTVTLHSEPDRGVTLSITFPRTL
ncbi:MAG TPA: GAF domain-containing sensor histidine kinase [Aggregatilinea sp.]|uniref:GAF domain-containing sensor histidine kinase n=1 Tax=Aggregatilinea sp. TaxID=2806333 RepID=UPI002CF04F0B|nr:GAF domain-containing sensor histidine kinase [Aggregatilinea sp.]HML20315.1 GAF domain-containing sensor histidine kinase [Aggregatilinea sp.]